MVENMTIRLDEENIIKYIQSFNQCQIRRTRHSSSKTNDLKIPFEEISKLVLVEKPTMIKKHKTKKISFNLYYF